MRPYTKYLSYVGMAIGALLCSQVAHAVNEAPRHRDQDQRIQLDAPTLAPMAYVRFCLEHHDECEVQSMKSAIGLTRERWAELVGVNAEVNRAIRPQADKGGVLAERWQVSPPAGNCHDYAVTKRHELLARGWPSRALLLAEVVTGWGEHHLVLVIRTRDGDFVADNLNANLRPWFASRYRWVRMQSPRNPRFWSTIAENSNFQPGPALDSSKLGGAKSDILVEAEESEVAMAANDDSNVANLPRIASTGAARTQDGISQNERTAGKPPIVVFDDAARQTGDLPRQTPIEIVDETDHGFTAVQVVATNVAAPILSGSLSIEADRLELPFERPLDVTAAFAQTQFQALPL